MSLHISSAILFCLGRGPQIYDTISIDVDDIAFLTAERPLTIIKILPCHFSGLESILYPDHVPLS